MIRAAKMVDTPRLVALMVEAQKTSRYAGKGAVDETYAKQLLKELILHNGGRSSEGTLVNVIEVNGQIEGYHIGMQQRIGLVGTKFEAADAQLYTTAQAPPFAFVELLEAFCHWAAFTPRIIAIRPGASDILGKKNLAFMSDIYRRLGFEEVGTIFEREVMRQEAAA